MIFAFAGMLSRGENKQRQAYNDFSSYACLCFTMSFRSMSGYFRSNGPSLTVLDSSKYFKVKFRDLLNKGLRPSADLYSQSFLQFTMSCKSTVTTACSPRK